jgi:DNA-damage-inducible protein J
VSNVNVLVDSEIKNKAQDIFSALGLDMAAAINIFLHQAVKTNGIPFELAAEPLPKTPQFGSAKGKMQEAEGHDWFEPMEDFKEYI